MKFPLFHIAFLLLIALLLIGKQCTLSALSPQHHKYSTLEAHSFVEEMKYRDNSWVSDIQTKMSTAEKVGQMFMLQVYSKDANPDTFVSRMIKDYGIGGLIFMQGNQENQALLTNYYQSISKVPLLIATDAEYGLAMRLTDGEKFPNHMTLGAIENDSLIYELGKLLGSQCQCLGVNINFAPVVDVNNNPANPVINFRSFGESPERVAQKALAYISGLQSQNVLACAKHFPGHGDTDADSHLSLPLVSVDRQRLDSVELKPYTDLIPKGLASVMVAHLQVPALEPKPFTPTSLSKRVVQELLIEELGFDGLIITDALNMKGATNGKESSKICIDAFDAGNHILLMPDNAESALVALNEHVSKKSRRKEALNKRVNKILTLKNWSGLNMEREAAHVSGNPQLNAQLKREIYLNALTLVKNEDSLLPLKSNTDSVLLIELGHDKASAFGNTLSAYTVALRLQQGWCRDINKQIPRALATWPKNKPVLLSANLPSQYPTKNFGIDSTLLAALSTALEPFQTITFVHGNPYALPQFDFSNTLACTYESSAVAQRVAARNCFGAHRISGKLPVSVSEQYPLGHGLQMPASKVLNFDDTDALILNPLGLRKVDSLIQHAITEKAIPGCQVFAAHKGSVFLNRAYGSMSYTDKTAITTGTLYDIASVTKVASSAICLMHFVEQGKVLLDTPIRIYLPRLREIDKGQLTLRQLMSHQSGLAAWIAFYIRTLNESGKPDPAYYSDVKDSEHQIEVVKGLYLRNNYLDTIRRRIDESELRSNVKYLYSDLGYYYLKEIIENVGGVPIHQLADSLYYQPLGLKRTTFLPLQKFSEAEIAPSEKDGYFRQREIRGNVHDMGAAMLGGVGGHAGLFSTASEIGRIMYLLRSGGQYGHQQYLSDWTISEFASRCFEDNRRGLCFDMAEPDTNRYNPLAESASIFGYGHSGFTGCFTWVDPEYDLIYVFLSNRTWPEMKNKKLIHLNTRTEVLEALIESVR